MEWGHVQGLHMYVQDTRSVTCDFKDVIFLTPTYAGVRTCMSRQNFRKGNIQCKLVLCCVILSFLLSV